MKRWRKICCGIDFSEPSRIAMLQAAELARDSGGELLLVHAYAKAHATLLATDLIAPADAEAMEQLVQELERKLGGWRDEAARIRGGPVDARVVIGDPASELLALARAEQADLVVVSTHGRTGIARAVLGSVAERVVREAHCSVLVARRPAV
jgi:universal stress protein A